MRRLKSASALVLTAFFAVAGAYHHHRLPPPTHDHAGLCSSTSAAPTLDACAICKAAHTAAHRLAVVAVSGGFDRALPLTVIEALALITGNASLLSDSRAPPAV